MPDDARAHWDAFYQNTIKTPYPDPDPLLLHYTPPGYRGARALDVASGVGQNGLWLATQGYTVDLLDISRVALMRAQVRAARRKIRDLNFFQVDLDSALLEKEAYDLIAIFRYLNRDLFIRLRASARPGCRIIYEHYNLRYRAVEPDVDPESLLKPGELAGFFAGWQVIRNAEPGHLTQFVAMKPR